MCKSIHDIIIIPFLFALLNLESVKRKGKNNFLDEMKTLFHNASNYIFSNCFEDKNTDRRQKQEDKNMLKQEKKLPMKVFSFT